MSDCQECKKPNYKDGWPQYNGFVGCYECADAVWKGFKDRFEREAHIAKYNAIIKRAEDVLAQATFERSKAYTKGGYRETPSEEGCISYKAFLGGDNM